MPKKVATAYARLRREYKGYISLNKVNGRYYVYRQTSAYIKGENNSKTVSEYLGKITEDGAFIRKVVTKEDELKNAMAIIQANTGKAVTNAERNEPEAPAAQAQEVLDEDDKKILMALSMNGRIEVPYMKKIMGIGKTDINYRIQRLEKRFNIKYRAVVGVRDALPYEEHLAFLKFREKPPTTSEIKSALEKNPYVQFAMMARGDFDLLVYFLTETEYLQKTKTINALQRSLFPESDVELHISPFYRHYGYVPLRDKFFEDVLRTRVWAPTKDNPKPSYDQITMREYAVLKELSAHGKSEFTRIDENYGFDRGRAQYTYSQLKAKHGIYRITVSLDNLPVKYIATFNVDITKRSRFDSAGRVKLLQSVVNEDPPITNRFVLEGDIYTPQSVLFIAPIFDDKQLEFLRQKLEDISGTSLRINMGFDTFGSLCYRRYDNMYNPIYTILEEEYGIKHEKVKINYEPALHTSTKRLDIRGMPMS